jgi:hypothetical protein
MMQKRFLTALPVIVVMLAMFLLIGCPEKPVEEKPEKEPVKEEFDVKVGDEVIAAYQMEDNFFATEFFPAKVVTKESEETKGKYEVELKYENKMVKHSTRNIVFKSHPATKEELKPDMVVLFTGGDDQPQTEEDLKEAKWGRGVILNTDDLDKDIVTLIGGGYKREYKRHLTAVRIIVEAPKELTKVPAE